MCKSNVNETKKFIIIVMKQNGDSIKLISEVNGSEVNNSYVGECDSSVKWNFERFFKTGNDYEVTHTTLKVRESLTHVMEICDEYYATKFVLRVQ